ncbi:hypothetical protein OTU49_005544 [Cherax quadricarinatus]|uniref:Uncharacterized protein n=1 Tax=Cherax quadricarinatus TaxID=27406 RepID=A0AAW0YLE0_CHEQU
MAEIIVASSLDKDAAVAGMSLVSAQPVPVTFEQLPLSKVKISKAVSKRPVHVPLPSASVANGFDNNDSSIPTLLTSSSCHITPVNSQINSLVTKTECEPLELSSDCRSPSDNRPSNSAQSPDESIPKTTDVLTSVNTSKEADSSSIIVGEEVARCVVVDLQGNMVAQEHASVQAPAVPCIVDEQLLVEATHDHQPRHTRTSDSTNNSRTCDESNSCVKGNKNISFYVEGAENKVSRKPEKKKCKNNMNSKFNSSKMTSHSDFRWDVDEDIVKSEYTLVSEPEQEDLTVKSECEVLNFVRARRKSANKARLKWKKIHEVDTIGKFGRKRKMHLNILPRKKHASEADDPLESIVNEAVVLDLPVWAQCLTSVRVLDNNWVVGVAASKEILHQTLEGHSRSVLCDYVKSHPSSLQQRHLARSQASRIMWHHQRIEFDGVPFSIVSSDDLKCAFGMKYKTKRRDPSKPAENIIAERPEGNFGQEGRADEHRGQTATRNVHKNPTRGGVDESVVPKKRYKDVTFTSCTARITVKVIVKYPGYAVPSHAMLTERKLMLKALRRDMSNGLDLEKEEFYHVTLPLSSVHNHPLQGRSRGVHPSISNKIKELISDGITAPKVIKGILDSHVEMQHVGDMIVPQPDDRAYYPRLKDIANLVYYLGKKMGITAKRKVSSEQVTLETSQRKRRKQKRARSGENEIVSDNVMSDSMPLQASTLQEAVQTFCTDESERGSLGDLEGRGCLPTTDVVSKDGHGEVGCLAEMVRGQLDTLRSLTYTLHEAVGLQEIYQSLQVILNQYVSNQHHALQDGITEAPAVSNQHHTLQDGITEAPAVSNQHHALQDGITEAPAATFIIQDPIVDPLSTSPAQGVPVSTAEHVVISERDETGSGITSKPRSVQNISSQHVRQLRTPVALQCLATSMVPTLTVSQLSRSGSQNPHQTHIVTSVSHGGNNTTTTIPTQTFQTLTPATQDGSPAPLHLSLPPYIYYVQEVTVPESSQNWTYTTSS